MNILYLYIFKNLICCDQDLYRFSFMRFNNLDPKYIYYSMILIYNIDMPIL